MRILIVGVSTRAIAESAIRGGHHVITLDYFGDRDQKALVENHSLLRDFGFSFSAGALRDAGRGLAYDALVYTANLENHPEAVDGLTKGKILLGNSKEVLHRLLDGRMLRRFCAGAAIPFPRTLFRGEERHADSASCWLLKPQKSGGGHGIGFWNGNPLDEDHLLQECLKGRSASLAFAADGKRSVILGVTEQLIGREDLGTGEFRWCGNIMPLEMEPSEKEAVLRDMERMVALLTQRFCLRGVNGIDMVMAEGLQGRREPFLVEVNPRFSASMELVERAYGLNVFSIHLEAMAGRLPDFSLKEHLTEHYLGKGIVFAKNAVIIPETEKWEESDIRDVPFSGDRIAAGAPICSVLAEGDGRNMCLRNVVNKAVILRKEVGDA